MHHEGTLIRPPSEANSIILQVTSGCPHNRCTFCAAYGGKSYRLKLEHLEDDLAFAARHCRLQQRVFLADGDVLALPCSILERILAKIRLSLPWVRRVSLYGSCRAIGGKTVEQLQSLRSLGLDRIYMGLESGNDEVLAAVCKGACAADMLEAAVRVRRSGMFLSVTVLLGVAGAALSQEHARSTGELLSEMAPNQIAALALMPIPGTPLHDRIRKKEISMPSPVGILQELRMIIEYTTADRVQLQANHASNYLPLSGRLQRDKAKLLGRLDDAIAGRISLLSEHSRAL